MTAMYFVVATPLMFAVCTVPGSMILVTLLVLALLVCSAVDRIRRKTWHRRAEALAPTSNTPRRCAASCTAHRRRPFLARGTAAGLERSRDGCSGGNAARPRGRE